ncbi:hypothetical protein [Desulfonema limicola]|nr:hypothetical protein [Desulfonema limicola]
MKGICVFIILLTLVTLFYPASDSLAGESVKLYFYSSETNINNYKSLKMEFDKYISSSGVYEFQPFSDRQTFEQQIQGKKKCLIFLSSWHYNKIYKDYSLHPLLAGVRNGKKTQKRILVASSKYPEIESVQNGPIASSSNIPFTRSILRDIFKEKDAAETARILTVPKDIDAMMSVGFEMSKSALITENTLNSLKGTDPVLFKKITPLASGRESLLLIVAAPEDFLAESEQIVQMLINMPKNTGGLDLIKMLDLDGWEKIEPSDILKLEG